MRNAEGIAFEANLMKWNYHRCFVPWLHPIQKEFWQFGRLLKKFSDFQKPSHYSQIIFSSLIFSSFSFQAPFTRFSSINICTHYLQVRQKPNIGINPLPITFIFVASRIFLVEKIEESKREGAQNFECCLT